MSRTESKFMVACRHGVWECWGARERLQMGMREFLAMIGSFFLFVVISWVYIYVKTHQLYHSDTSFPAH